MNERHNNGSKGMSDVLTQLTAVLEQRKAEGSAESSYVAQLHKKGLNKILEKLGEECTETIIAAKDTETGGDMNHVICETADLWFHSLVMLSHLGESADTVLDELARRFNLSGLAEKAARQQN